MCQLQKLHISICAPHHQHGCVAAVNIRRHGCDRHTRACSTIPKGSWGHMCTKPLQTHSKTRHASQLPTLMQPETLYVPLPHHANLGSNICGRAHRQDPMAQASIWYQVSNMQRTRVILIQQLAQRSEEVQPPLLVPQHHIQGHALGII